MTSCVTVKRLWQLVFPSAPFKQKKLKAFQKRYVLLADFFIQKCFEFSYKKVTGKAQTKSSHESLLSSCARTAIRIRDSTCTIYICSSSHHVTIKFFTLVVSLRPCLVVVARTCSVLTCLKVPKKEKN
jgi:hypothetical protein